MAGDHAAAVRRRVQSDFRGNATANRAAGHSLWPVSSCLYGVHDTGLSGSRGIARSGPAGIVFTMNGTATLPLPRSKQAGTTPLCAGPALAADQMDRIRREMVLNFCKWDPQVEDVSTLAPFPLFINRYDWDELAYLAEQLTAELLAAEVELLKRPELHRLLGIPRRLRRMLARINETKPTPAAVRAMRFDFHWTTDGWQISEVNSDVPGGFSEASEFTRMMQEAIKDTAVPGNPSAEWTNAICEQTAGKPVALLSAPGFMEDQQVISYLSRKLLARGVEAYSATPQQLLWSDGQATLQIQAFHGQIGAIVRFYQGEWIVTLPQKHWIPLFVGGKTPVTNPAAAILSESKRFGLIWDRLKTPLPAWRKLLPESRDPRDVSWRSDDGWLLKLSLIHI